MASHDQPAAPRSLSEVARERAEQLRKLADQADAITWSTAAVLRENASLILTLADRIDYERTGDPAIDRERMIEALAPEVRPYFEGVIEDWMGYWRVHPDQEHRYARDLAAFIGERVLTDFECRDLERKARRGE